MDSLAVGVNKLELRAGDVVVVRCGRGPLTHDEIRQLRAHLAAALPAGVRTLILSGDIDLTVMRDSVPVEPTPAEADPAVVCQVSVEAAP